MRFRKALDLVDDLANAGVTGAFMAEPPAIRRDRLFDMMEDDLIIIESPPRPGVRPTDDTPSTPFAFFRALEI